MDVLIRTPEGEYFTQERVRCLDVTTETGALQILPGHADLHASITFSPVRIETEDRTETFIVQQGFLLVKQETNEAHILAYRVEKRSEISKETASEYMQRLLEALQNKESLSEYELSFLDNERLATEERIAFLEQTREET